jgi:sulfide:quinone oxidoreductase
VHWIKSAVAAFEPKDNAVILDGCRVVKYNRLIVAPGLKLDWDGSRAWWKRSAATA